MLKAKLQIFSVLGIFFLVLLSSCSTEKDAALNVGYHNMTARYNGYFNARVLIEEALESYRSTTSEDYTKILPLDLYPSKEDVPTIQEVSEEAQEKCETVIQRHSMPSSNTRSKDVENCRWIDDNWFVIGQIHYLRHEYVKAVDIFKFISESPMYVDQERVHEARLWLAKTYIAQGKFPEAKRILAQVEIDMSAAEAPKEKKQKVSRRTKKRLRRQAKKDKKNGVKKPAPFPKQLKDEYELTMAEFYIAQKNYKKAIPHLEKGIELTRKKKKKARYKFVLAQIYQELGQGEQAAFYFGEVFKSNAPYEMRFQAQIQKALSATSGGNEIRKELTKMLKDPKNEEYKDQIYYALAEMEMNDGNKELAIQYYHQSVFYSIKNDRQKGISYLRLADIHFEDKDYLAAQKYYDSCVQVLPEEYENYEKIKGKAEGLEDLVFHYETYVFEDSVQQKAQMPPEELEAYLEQQIKDMQEAERKRKEEEERRLRDQQNRLKNSNINSGSGSKWYFYNNKVSSSGFNDFRALWGQRPLEDDWRRSTKTSFSFDPDNPDSDSTDLNDLAQDSDSLTVEMLMADLPLTPELMDSSNNRLMNSLYMLGIIYKEQLKQDKEAIKYFELVVNRGIEHKKVLPSLYQLYLLYKKSGNAKANSYKETIFKDYPDSEIAMILQDPDYLKKKQEKEMEELKEYSEVLENYRYQRYNRVIQKCNDVIANDTANVYLNKYYLLKAFSIGKSRPGNTPLVREPLEKLYAISPTSEEGVQAKEYLDKLDKGLDIVKPDTAQVEIPSSPYIFDEKVDHYFVLIVPQDAGNIKPIEYRLSNFNSQFHKSKKLKNKTVPLGTDQLIVVQVFTEKRFADDYTESFGSDTVKPTLGKMAEEYEHFLISAPNFIELIKANDLQDYLDFYKENYQ